MQRGRTVPAQRVLLTSARYRRGPVQRGVRRDAQWSHPAGREPVPGRGPAEQLPPTPPQASPIGPAGSVRAPGRPEEESADCKSIPGRWLPRSRRCCRCSSACPGRGSLAHRPTRGCNNRIHRPSRSVRCSRKRQKGLSNRTLRSHSPPRLTSGKPTMCPHRSCLPAPSRR